MRDTSCSSWCCCLATVNTLVLQSSISAHLVLLTKYSNLTSGSWWNVDDLWWPHLSASSWNLKQTHFAWTLNAVFTWPAMERQATNHLKRMHHKARNWPSTRWADLMLDLRLHKFSHLTTHARHTEFHDDVDECLNYTSKMTSASCCTS